MGVKSNFRKYIQGLDGVHMIYLKDLQDSAVAIDIYGIMYKLKFTLRDNFIMGIKKYLTNLLKHKILPIIVFEGKAPSLKIKEIAARNTKQRDIREKLVTLRTDLQNYKETGEKTILLEELLNKEDSDRPHRVQPAVFRNVIEDITEIDPYEKSDNIKKIESHIEKTSNQLVKITDDDILLVKNLCEEYNILTLKAPGEAEQLCAWLCINKYVDHAISDDSDLIPLLCPSLLYKKDSFFVRMTINEILSRLSITKEQLVDWAILCGTDYNSNIRGIGVVRSLELIKTHKSIEAMEEENIFSPDVFETLNYKAVRCIYNVNTLDDDKNVADFIPLIDSYTSNKLSIFENYERLLQDYNADNFLMSYYS